MENKSYNIQLCIAILILIIIIVAVRIYDNNTTTSDDVTDSISTTVIETEEIVCEQWWTDEELDILAAVIYYEAGSSWCTDRHQQLVGQVVINRVNSHEFPDTIYDVVTQTKPTLQYASRKMVLKNAGNRDIIPQRCYDNALVVLNGEVECPDDVVWQAEFIQGEIYEIYETPHSTTYFCHRRFSGE